MGFLEQNNQRAKESQKDFGLLPDGDYELFAVEGKWRDEVGKTPNANLTFVVRSDVEQEGKGRKIFHTFYVSRDPEKVQTSLDFIQRFNLALGVPDGVKFETPQDWINYILGKPVKGRVGKHEYNGKEYNEIKWFNESDFASINPDMVKAAQSDKPNNQASLDKAADSYANRKPIENPFADPFAGSGQIDISDDDLPF